MFYIFWRHRVECEHNCSQLTYHIIMEDASHTVRPRELIITWNYFYLHLISNLIISCVRMSEVSVYRCVCTSVSYKPVCIVFDKSVLYKCLFNRCVCIVEVSDAQDI